MAYVTEPVDESPTPLSQGVSDKIKTDLIGTGIFLESDVYQLFHTWDEDRVFDTHREYPYSYGVHPLVISGTIDVLTETSVDNGASVLVLPIECKKADPNLKHWVFETHRQTRPKDMPMFLVNKDNQSSFTREYNFTNLGYNTYTDYENCVNVFEFSEAEGRVSRNTQKELRAYYAIKQANEAVPGVLEKISVVSRNPSGNNYVIPIVVTTANLFVADYDPKNINRETGDIDLQNLNLISKDWVLYSYPLEFHEGVIGVYADRGGQVRVRPEKRPTFVVNALALPTFINKLLADISYIS